MSASSSTTTQNYTRTKRIQKHLYNTKNKLSENTKYRNSSHCAFATLLLCALDHPTITNEPRLSRLPTFRDTRALSIRLGRFYGISVKVPDATVFTARSCQHSAQSQLPVGCPLVQYISSFRACLRAVS
jgi:hypothetical protein